MAIVDFLKGLGATHLFTLDNEGTAVTDDKGDSVDPTNIKGGSYSFVTEPVCEGFAHALKSTGSDDVTTRTEGATFDSRNDINGVNGDGNDNSLFEYVDDLRSVHLWMRTPNIDNPTCVFKQGGPSSNFALILSPSSLTFQAAVSGDSFLITETKFKPQVNRNYFVVMTWEHASKSIGTGSKISLIVNGVLQGFSQDPAAISDFTSHSGEWSIGNTALNLKTYNEGVVPFATRVKYENLLGAYNNVKLSVTNSREIFERTVIPTITIAADSVVNQQMALDALVNHGYIDNNCAIRIVQATDATDYRLFVDSVTFTENPYLNDIAVQYVGPNTLTLENTNGSNVIVTSAPAEVELVASTLAGGGSIALVEGTIRKTVAGVYGDITATKLVISTAGDYVFDTLNVDEIENVSGGIVNVSALNTVPKNTNTSGTLNFGVRGEIKLSGIISSAVYVQDSEGNEIEFTADFTGDKTINIPSAATGKWAWVVSRPGYEKIVGTADADKVTSQNIGYAQKIDLGTGLSLYSGMTSSNLSFAVTGGKIIGTFVGDISAQFFFNQLETFLATKAGCSWLVDNPDSTVIQISTDFAGQLLILPDNLAVMSNSTGTKKLSAFVVTNEKPFETSFFGSVVYNSSESSADISKAVWDYLSENATVTGSLGEKIDILKNHALAANLQTQR